MKRLIIFSLLLLTGMNSHANTFAKADAWYTDGQYDSALVAFESMLGEKEHSASLYFAIGNCHYRTGNKVKAILYYEKAAKLEPDNADIKANIQFLRRQFKDKVNTDRSGISGWVFSIVNDGSPNQWTWLALILINFAFLSFILSRLSSNKIARMAKVFGIIALLLGILRLFPAWYQSKSILHHDQGIVAEDHTEVRSSPSDNSNTVFILSEGTKVNINRKNELWVEINIGDANQGWVPKEMIYEI